MNHLDNKQIVAELLEIRKSLFMWKMDIKGVDLLLSNFGYDTSDLEQYDFSKVDYTGKIQSSEQWRAANVNDLINDL